MAKKGFWDRLFEPVPGQGVRGMKICPDCETKLEAVPGLYSMDFSAAMAARRVMQCPKCIKPSRKGAGVKP